MQVKALLKYYSLDKVKRNEATELISVLNPKFLLQRLDLFQHNVLQERKKEDFKQTPRSMGYFHTWLRVGLCEVSPRSSPTPVCCMPVTGAREGLVTRAGQCLLAHHSESVSVSLNV